MQKYLYQDAQVWQRRKQYDYVLALLNQIYDRNPKFPALDRALGIVTDKLIDANLAQGEFQAAHTLLAALENKFPQDPQVGRLQQKLQKLADATLVQAQADLAAGHLRHAQELCQKALGVWPTTRRPGLVVKLHEQFPYVMVGVGQPLTNQEPRLDNWAEARAGRLLHTPLVEFTGYGTEGGNYICPFGSMEESDLGLRLTFHLRPDVRWPNGSPLTGFDVSRTLLDYPPGDAMRFAPWADLIERVDVSDVYSVSIRFRQAPLQPEAIFQTSLVPPSQLRGTGGLGLFTRGEPTASESPYVASNLQFGRSPRTPKEIVERHFDGERQALDGAAAARNLSPRSRQPVASRIPPRSARYYGRSVCRAHGSLFARESGTTTHGQSRLPSGIVIWHTSGGHFERATLARPRDSPSALDKRAISVGLCL